MQFFFALGLAGITFALIFFAKPKSLPPFLKAAVIGVRIILAICVVIGIWYWNHEQHRAGRDFWGDLQLNKNQLIGKWHVEYNDQNEDLYKTTLSFYPDSTFYSSNSGEFGHWSYSPDNEILTMYHKDLINEFEIKSFNRNMFRTSAYGTFSRLHTLPEDKAKIQEAQSLSVTEVEDQIIKDANIQGRWNLKLVRHNGSLTDDLGMYTLNEGGAGLYLNDSSAITYKLNLNKNRFTISRNDQIITLNVKSFDGEVLIGYPDEEPENKYVFTKGL